MKRSSNVRLTKEDKEKGTVAERVCKLEDANFQRFYCFFPWVIGDFVSNDRRLSFVAMGIGCVCVGKIAKGISKNKIYRRFLTIYFILINFQFFMRRIPL